MKELSRVRRRFSLAFVASILGLAVVLGLAEIGFRVAHVLRADSKAPTADSELGSSAEKSRIRIVVLGESTSAPSFWQERDIAWPEQLESKLNQRFSKRLPPISFRVINLARAASSSPFQVALFEHNVAALQPDILISMLGVNDARVHSMDGNFLYQNSYLVRFFYWAEVAWSCPQCHQLNLGEEKSNPNSFNQRSHDTSREALLKLSREPILSIEDLDRFRIWFSKLESSVGDDQHLMNSQVAQRLFAISQQPGLRGSVLSRSILNEAKAILDRSYRNVVLTDSSALEHYCHIRTQLREGGCVEAVKEAFRSGFRLTPQVLTIAAQEGASEDEFLRKVYRSAGFEISSEKIGGKILTDSFRRLEAIVNQRGIVWMPMQYPTGSVGALQYYLSNSANENSLTFRDSFDLPAGRYIPRSRDFILISNENFKSHVTAKNESDYFRDFFGRDRGLNFGHTTEKGHELIASNVADQIEKSWPEIEPRLLEKTEKTSP